MLKVKKFTDFVPDSKRQLLLVPQIYNYVTQSRFSPPFPHLSPPPQPCLLPSLYICLVVTPQIGLFCITNSPKFLIAIYKCPRLPVLTLSVHSCFAKLGNKSVTFDAVLSVLFH